MGGRGAKSGIKPLDKSAKSGIIEIKNGSGTLGKYPVRLPDSKNHAKLADNQTIVGKAFAGKGTKTEIRERFSLEAKYNVPANDWRKMSGNGYVIADGKKRKAELHWYEGNGKITDIKIKRYIE